MQAFVPASFSIHWCTVSSRVNDSIKNDILASFLIVVDHRTICSWHDWQNCNVRRFRIFHVYVMSCYHPAISDTMKYLTELTHWGRVTHICVSKLTIIGSDNGLAPGRRQAIIRTNAGILLIGPLGTNFSEILIEIQAFSLKKIRLKMSSAKCCTFRLGLNVLMP